MSDTRLPGMDGFALVEDLRKHPEWADIPVIFLSSDLSVESKVHGLERGVEDYLTKPIYIKEIIARVNLVLQRKQRAGLGRCAGAASRNEPLHRLAGRHGPSRSAADDRQQQEVGRAVPDLGHSAARSTSARATWSTPSSARCAANVRSIARWSGAKAASRSTSATCDARMSSSTSTQGVLMEGMRRVDDWGRLLEQLPDLTASSRSTTRSCSRRLPSYPDEINIVLSHFDGKRSVLQIVDRCDGDDLETLTVMSKLFFEGLIYDTGRRTAYGSSVQPTRGTDRAGQPSVPSIGSSDGDLISFDDLDARPSVRTEPGVARSDRAASDVAEAVRSSRPVQAAEEEARDGTERSTLDYAPKAPEHASKEANAASSGAADDEPRARRSRRWQHGSEITLPGLNVDGTNGKAEARQASGEATTRSKAAGLARARKPAAHQEHADDGANAETEPPPAPRASGSERPTREALWTGGRRKRRRRKRTGLVTSPGLLSSADLLAHDRDGESPQRPSPSGTGVARRDVPLMDSRALVTDPPPAPPPVPAEGTDAAQRTQHRGYDSACGRAAR